MAVDEIKEPQKNVPRGVSLGLYPQQFTPLGHLVEEYGSFKNLNVKGMICLCPSSGRAGSGHSMYHGSDFD